MNGSYLNTKQLRPYLTQLLAVSINHYVGAYLTYFGFALFSALGIGYY